MAARLEAPRAGVRPVTVGAGYLGRVPWLRHTVLVLKPP
jgi:hypothetical protein